MPGFYITRQLEDGHPLRVAWRETREEAEQLIAELSGHWPAEYDIEEVEAEQQT
jgi:hypothetical protein